MCPSLRRGFHLAINPRSVEFYSDGCPSGSFTHLNTGSLELSHIDHQVLDQLSYQVPSPPIAQFGRMASFRKSPGCSKLQCSRIYLQPSPDLCFDLMAWFLLWYALSAAKTYLDGCVPFQILSNQLNLPQVDSNQGVETSQRWSREMGGTFQVSQYRVWILMSMWHLSFSFLNTFAKIQFFRFVIMGYWM